MERVSKLSTSEETVFIDFWLQCWWQEDSCKGLLFRCTVVNLKTGKSGEDFDVSKIWYDTKIK